MAYVVTIVFGIASMVLFLFLAKATKRWQHGMKRLFIQAIKLILSPHALIYFMYPFLFERHLPYDWSYNPITGAIILTITFFAFIIFFKDDYKIFLSL